MIEMDFKQYSYCFEVGRKGVFINRKDGGSRTNCLEISTQYNRIKISKKGSEYNQRYYRIPVVNEKHICGILMKQLGETKWFNEYRNSKEAIEIIEAINNSRIEFYQEPFTTIVTANYNNSRPNNPSVLPSSSSANKEAIKYYEELRKYKNISWLEFLSAFASKENVVTLDISKIEQLNDSPLKDFLLKENEINSIYADVLIEMFPVLKEEKRKGYLISAGSNDEMFDNKKIVACGSNSSRVGSLSRPMYKINYSFRIYLNLSEEIETKLGDFISLCSNGAVVETKRAEENVDSTMKTINLKDACLEIISTNNVEVIDLKKERIECEKAD